MKQGNEKAVGFDHMEEKERCGQEHAAELLMMGNCKSEEQKRANSIWRILQYADKYDVLLVLVGLLGAIGDGICAPTLLIIVRGIVDAFGKGATPQFFVAVMSKYALYIIYVGLGGGLASFFEAAAWIKTGERQASRLRCLYLKAVLRQDESFFDLRGANAAEVVNSIEADMLIIQDVIGEKVPHFTKNLSTFVASYIVAFYMASKLAAISLAFMPLLVIPGLLYGRTLAGLARSMHTEYTKAGAVAEQAISCVRTVYACVGEERTLHEFSCKLEGIVKLGLKQGLAKGLAVGSNGLVFVIWAFLAWYGSQLVMDGGVSGGKVIAIGLLTITGGLALGASLPDLKHFLEANVAGARICDLIERVPAIDSEDNRGLVMEVDKVKGEIELKNVSFAYPARPDTLILDDFTLHIPAGKTLALVGGSGSGKSTVISLLLRFYDPWRGVISLDGTPIKLLQLKNLRAQMGLVSQEPALFATTIKQNIVTGKEGASMEDIIEAATQANAHNFITQLPDAYETQVGEHGVQMSGGQKQRIAIARALLKDPPILLLDEATSALDAESERVVQAALDQAVLGRTTLIISHHLSSIQSAHMIAVLHKGKIVELGQHNKLLVKESGAYARLVHAAAAGACASTTASALRDTIKTIFCTQGYVSSSHLSYPNHPRASSFQSSSTPTFRRLVALNKPEWWQAVKGTMGACAFGVIQPLYAFTLGSVISAFYLTDREEQRHSIRNYTLSFIGLAIASFLTSALQHYYFTAMGEILTKRVRERMLANILRFEVGWFDKVENSSGVICSRLASEANLVRALVGDRWSLIISTSVATIVAATFGLLISWRLASVMLAVQPLAIVCYYARRVLIRNISNQALSMRQQSSHLAAEAVAHHRIIAAFSSQDTILRLFSTLQGESRGAAWRQAMLGGMGLSGAQVATHLILALSYWYGGRLHSQGLLTVGAMFKTLFILLSTGRVIADAGSMTADIAKGAAAVGAIFATLDRKTFINPDDPDAVRVQQVAGAVELHHVAFAYPSRPQVLVFSDLSLQVRAGHSLALVGPSGSGKSTIIGVILRFYDPLSGKVTIDGRDVRELHLRTLRQHIGLVSQEPSLFAGSVRSNIEYGDENATEEELVEAAKAANAHDFICSLERGYDTNVGERGAQLSGGQKQRIAIARAIVKRPAILLLDEATSALDMQSEKVVQEAMERVMSGRTTIVVAHRLSTIHKCDIICVLENGSVVESGSHAQLLAKGPSGAYFKLVHLQQQSIQLKNQTFQNIT